MNGTSSDAERFLEAFARTEAAEQTEKTAGSNTHTLTKEDFEGEDIYKKVSDYSDEIALSNYIKSLEMQAKELGLKRFFEEKMKPYKRQRLEQIRAAKPAEVPDAEESFPYIVSEYDPRTKQYRHKVSCPLLAEHFKSQNHYFFRQIPYDERFDIFLYTDGVYKNVNDAYLKSMLKDYITAYDIKQLKMADVSETLQIIKADKRFLPEDKINAYENCINFTNGIYIISRHELIPHTPKLCSTIQLDCRYDPAQTECPTFLDYIDKLTGGNEEVKTLLLEYMAVAVSSIPGKHFKKALFIYGKGDTGKSQLLLLTQRLLGSENFSVCNLKQLETRFGKTALYHKRLVGTGEMSFMTVDELLVFKAATGGDQISMEFKGKNSFPYCFRGLLWFCANALPRFGGDRGDWVYERMLTVECSNVIPPEERDPRFVDRLFAERDAIVQQLLPYLDRVIANGLKFDVPQSVIAARQTYRSENSPVLTFIKECCEPADKVTADAVIASMVTVGVFYNVFIGWYKDNVRGNASLSHQKFRAELETYFGCELSKVIITAHAGRFYPLMLTDETRDTYRCLIPAKDDQPPQPPR